MVLRLAAAICGAGMLFVHSFDVMNAKAAAHINPTISFIDSTRLRIIPVAMGPTIEGTASMYNPYRSGEQEGSTETASGELYDPRAWTAAIQRGLRDRFGGVRFGKGYQHTYALVESAGRTIIVKVNDVGPLKPGRVIDLNEQAMRYFDPTLRLGLINHVKVWPLLGDDWTTGPIEGNLRGIGDKPET